MCWLHSCQIFLHFPLKCQQYIVLGIDSLWLCSWFQFNAVSFTHGPKSVEDLLKHYWYVYTIITNFVYLCYQVESYEGG